MMSLTTLRAFLEHKAKASGGKAVEGREIERDEGWVRDRQTASDSERTADDALLSTHGRKLCRYDPYSTRKPGLREQWLRQGSPRDRAGSPDVTRRYANRPTAESERPGWGCTLCQVRVWELKPVLPSC